MFVIYLPICYLSTYPSIHPSSPSIHHPSSPSIHHPSIRIYLSIHTSIISTICVSIIYRVSIICIRYLHIIYLCVIYLFYGSTFSALLPLFLPSIHPTIKSTIHVPLHPSIKSINVLLSITCLLLFSSGLQLGSISPPRGFFCQCLGTFLVVSTGDSVLLAPIRGSTGMLLTFLHYTEPPHHRE